MTAIGKDFLDKIKGDVANVIELGRDRLLKQEEDEARRAREANAEWVATARSTLVRVPSLVRDAIREGRRSVTVVAKIAHPPSWMSHADGWAVPVSQLVGWERIVADAIEEMGYVVAVREAHDGAAGSCYQLDMSW